MGIKKTALTRRTAYADLPERMTVYEFARVNDVGKSTVYEAIARGALPVIQIGRRKLIPRTAMQPKELEP